MKPDALMMPDPKVIIYSVGSGILLTALIMGAFVKLMPREQWVSLGTVRRRSLGVSLIACCFFLTAYLPLLVLRFRAGESRDTITALVVLFGLGAAVVITELLRTVLPSGAAWTGKKHLLFVMIAWVGFAALAVFVIRSGVLARILHE
jgi:ABC-type Mn2+/Zn2+ transport system permease subunit